MPEIQADTLGWVIAAVVAVIFVAIVAMLAYWLRR